MTGLRKAFSRPQRLWPWLAVLLLAPGWAAAADEDACPTRTVAVFDVGSGTTRVHVAEIAGCGEAGWQTLLRRDVAVGFAADLARQANGRFSAEIMQQASAAVEALVEAARAAGAEEFVGVATSAFRSAANAAELVAEWQDRFGLRVDIISQRDEGHLAYRLIEAGQPQPGGLLVWDIGAGSQQLVWRCPDDGRFESFHSDLASISFRNLAIAELRRPPGTATPNPIGPDELARLAALVREQVGSEVPAELKQLIGDGARVVGVGGVHGASLIGQAGLRPGDELNAELLRRVLEGRLGLDDAAIGGAYADTQVTNLVLVLELMAVLGIDRYQATRADLTDALLVEFRDRMISAASAEALP